MQATPVMSYDVIGDIHGHDALLLALLRKLGYRLHLGAWRHAGRTAVFVGDFIYRGPGQLEQSASSVRCSTLDQPRRSWAITSSMQFPGTRRTPNQRDCICAGAIPSTGSSTRPFSRKNRAFARTACRTRFLVPFASAVAGTASRARRSRVLGSHSMTAIQPLLEPGNTLNRALVEASSRPGSMEHHAVETLLKGIEVPSLRL